MYVNNLLKTGLGAVVQFTLPITPSNYAILVDGNAYTILSQNSLYAYQTSDFGVTWSAVPISGIDKTAQFYGATSLNGTPVIFTSLGVYVGVADGGIKVIPQYTSSTPGQKYVVKAE
ncbi:hypothetical protein D3C85_1210400 [compost metagenome]